MSELSFFCKNSPTKGITTVITILTENDSLFIREDSQIGNETDVIWLSNKSALEIANWILDNIKEVEE